MNPSTDSGQAFTPAARFAPIKAEFESLLDRPLLTHQANRLESLAVTLGVRLAWRHIDINAGKDENWKPGRAPHA